MGKKSRERRERQQQRMVEVQRARVAQSGRLFDEWKTQGWRATYCGMDAVVNSQNVFSYVYDQFALYDNTVNIACHCFLWGGDAPENWIDFFSSFNLKPPFKDMFLEWDMLYGGETYGMGVFLEYVDNEIICEVYEKRNDEMGNIGYFVFYINLDGYGLSKMEFDTYDHNNPLFHSSHSYDTHHIAGFVALFTLQFLNCRNIELVDHEPDPAASREYERHFGRPLTKYKTLQIKPTGKQYEGGEQKSYQGIMPLHIRRGNFATYTDDAPLFGKYTGTFWRPATAVGERDNGIVVKDYEVIAPDE